MADLSLPPFLDRNLTLEAVVARGEHSPVGASASHCYIPCNGSVALAYGRTDEEDDTYSSEGDMAHTVLEDCLNNDRMGWECIGDGYWDPKRQADWVCTKDVADGVQMGLDYIMERRSYLEEHGAVVQRTFVEQGYDHSAIVLGFRGQMDCGIVWEEALDLFDLKWGQGVLVEVKENPQLMSYAVGILLLMTEEERDRIKRVRLHVMQPRAEHADGPMRVWETSVEHLMKWFEATLKPAMDRSLAILAQKIEAIKNGEEWKPDLATLSMDMSHGGHCHFCSAKTVCPLAQEAYAAATDLPEGMVTKLADFELAAYLDQVPAAKKVIKALLAEGYTRAARGESIPGWKLVTAKVNRVWLQEREVVDEETGEVRTEKLTDAAEATFGEEAYEPKALKSPAQVEKMKGGKAFATGWAHKPKPGLTLVEAGDSRPAVRPKTAKDVFGAVVETQD